MANYGRCYRSKQSPVLACINTYLVRWIGNKYRRLDRTRAAHVKLAELAAGQPRQFLHWAWVTTAGDEDDKSPVTGDRRAGICGSRGAAMSSATRPCSQQGLQPNLPRRGAATPTVILPQGPLTNRIVGGL